MESLPTPPSFTPASSLPRTPLPDPPPSNNAQAGPSNRNASNAHLPTPPVPTDAAPDTEPPVVAAPAGPVKPVNKGSGKRSIVVNACQRGNPVLKAIQNIGWEYGDIVPDYQVGASTCVLYLSLKYHRLHPEYLHNRIEKLKGMYTLRVLLVMCDVNEHQEPIREITKVCLINQMTVILAWTTDEAATYLATYKSFEFKPPDLLKERVHKDYAGRLSAVLTSVRGVNKTDVMTLGTNFGSFKNMVNATPEQLALCPGLGDVKVRRLHDAFNLPFRVIPGDTGVRTVGNGVKNGAGKGKDKDKGNDREAGQMSISESVERGRSVSATPAGGSKEDAIGVEGEGGGAEVVYSPDWPEEEEAEGEGAKETEGGKAGKGTYVDALESDDEDEEGRPPKRAKT